MRERRSARRTKSRNPRPPYGWTLLPRVAALCCAPTFVVGLAIAALHAFHGLLSDNNATHQAAMSAVLRVTLFFDVAAIILAAVGTVLAAIVARSRTWSDKVIVVLLCLVIAAAAAGLVRHRAGAASAVRFDDRSRAAPR